MKLILVLTSLIGLGNCGESSVTINVKHAINTISDRFISYEVEFADMMEISLGQNSMDNLNLISPSYLKLKGFSSYLKGLNKEYAEADVAAMFRSLK